MVKKPQVVHIFLENQIVINSLFEKIGVLSLFVSRKRAMKYISERYFPNQLLLELKKKSHIGYRTHILKAGKKLVRDDVLSIPKGDIWLFSLINMEDFEIFTDLFMKAVAERADSLGIEVFHLTSHLDSGTLNLSTPVHEYPKIAKLRSNGTVVDFRKESFYILHSDNEEKMWTKHIGKNRERYVTQSFLKDQRCPENGGLYFIERWLLIGDDLSVGMRMSTSPIVKQHNSVTHYRRDMRKLWENNEYDLIQSYLGLQQVKKGLIPATFEYYHNDEFWDQRYAVVKNHKEETGFELGSMDVMNVNNQLVVIDYNEHPLETLHPDLTLVLRERMKKYLGVP